MGELDQEDVRPETRFKFFCFRILCRSVKERIFHPAYRKEHHSCRIPNELSGGENQRIAVARAMINKPDILLCDEPTGSLDEENSLVLMEALIETAKKNKTAVILVSHSRQIALLMKKQFYLNNGCLVLDAGK